jgi:hypothetical protein
VSRRCPHCKATPHWGKWPDGTLCLECINVRCPGDFMSGSGKTKAAALKAWDNAAKEAETMGIEQINEISSKRYGHPMLELEPTAALWLAEHILEEHHKNVYKTIANARAKLGKYTPFPVFGTPLYNGIGKIKKD